MKKVILAILDGFGYREETTGNAILAANPTHIKKLWDRYPHSLLSASGTAVGLPEGQMGNSEVGHLNIGAGRVVYQPLEEINQSIKNGSFYQNSELLKVLEHCKKNNSAIHLFGLLSDGGIHSHINHFFAMLELCKRENFSHVYVHAFLDGRDTLPNVALTYLAQLEEKMKELEVGKLVDVSGRYYSMDRERMWNLTEQYYQLLVEGKGPRTTNVEDYIKECYKKEIYDEFIPPVKLVEEGTLEENDGLVMINFRPDRITQLFTAITNDSFSSFQRKAFHNIKLVTMKPCEKTVIGTAAFPLIRLKNTLGVYLSKKGKKVLRIAEASKYPHVTYFFDGGEELDLPLTDKIIIPRKEVATYDLYPAMSSYELTDQLIKVMENYDVIILNFANCDMVGHTGNFEATVEAVKAVDKNIGRIYEACQEKGFTMILTADHGNADCLKEEDGAVITSHTISPVPFLITDSNYQVQNGKLGDIAPTLLYIMGEKIPCEMTGKVLVKDNRK